MTLRGLNIFQTVDLIGKNQNKLKGLNMNKWLILFLMLSLDIMQAIQLQAQTYTHSSIKKNTDNLTITINKLDVNDSKLKLSYEIKNISELDVWICDDTGFDIPYDFEVILSEDNQILTIRRRLDVPVSPNIALFRRPRGKYIRLRPGEKQDEYLSVNTPLDAKYVFDLRRPKPIPRSCFYVPRLAIEIGYYVGNLPEMILNMIEEADKTYLNNVGTTPPILKTFGGALSFNYSREGLRNRDQEIVIPYTHQQLKGEEVLSTVINKLNIPCQKRQGPSKEDRQRYRRSGFGPDLKTCTRIEIRYKPSALEYVFPFAINQGLLSREEIEYLQSERTFVIEDQNILKSFANKMIRFIPSHGIVRENTIAHFDCYHDNGQVTSFKMYGDDVVETEEKKRLSYYPSFVSAGMLAPEIQKLEYRVQCAVNLRDLYHRLRFYNVIVARRQNESPVKNAVIYPESTDWSDAITSHGPLPKSDIKVFIMQRLKKPHVCPSVGEAKSTYAMNPNCKPDSSPDMVLLFETKAGWSQHGGPELFTFDNHDPKGGCVLLNDGTVKFIRAKEELQQLRWK